MIWIVFHVKMITKLKKQDNLPTKAVLLLLHCKACVVQLDVLSLSLLNIFLKICRFISCISISYRFESSLTSVKLSSSPEKESKLWTIKYDRKNQFKVGDIGCICSWSMLGRKTSKWSPMATLYWLVTKFKSSLNRV